ncbi:MAG: phosphate/phosphite/phosphonate ABC transporter substrate-binding protein [Bacteroidota bacterium]|nr:phosphate/phosphite/phosphonate ABC transporter substrate-binding protein [Candidatus Kapabacteria bacterium]MDW8074777.1 phosphate/phosphite/phosphonate ABC transporter substrate-binding protein [Bacteroidota bacterium]
MRYVLVYGTFTLVAIAWITIRALLGSSQAPVGSASRPIQLMLTPSVENQKVTTSADSLVAYLHRATGLHFTAAVPSSYIVVVESFGSGAADIAITNTFSYVLAHEKYGANAALMVVRRGGETHYRGQIIAHKESGIRRIEDLGGKRFAFVDAASTSGYILPKALLDRHGIRLGQTLFAGRHDNVVTMVYQRQVDAGATYYSPPDPATGEILDARARVKTHFPDVFDKVRIIALTEEIPNDPIVFRRDFPPALRDMIVRALLEFQKTPTGRRILYDAYSIEGFAPASDRDYDRLRELIRNFGGDLRALLHRR